jgi:hypothetical protein
VTFTHLPDSFIGEATTTAAPDGPSIFIVPTCWVCDGGLFTGVESKFDWKMVSLEQLENSITIRGIIRKKYGLFSNRRILSAQGTFIKEIFN